MAMFAPTRPQQSSFLVELKCGKMKLDGRRLTADATKGLLYIHQTDDQLMHLCWKDRASGNIHDDLIIFPEDIEFAVVPGCPDGRVYCLMFKNSNRRDFFWMQDANSEKDLELCRKVNDLLNNPPPAGSRQGRNESSLGMDRLAGLGQSLGLTQGSEGAADMASMNNMDQNQLMQLLSLMGSGGGAIDPNLLNLGLGGGGANASAAPAATPTTATATPAATGNPPATSPPVQLSDLQNILQAMPGAANPPRVQESVDLTDVLSSANVQFVTGREDYSTRLIPHLPTESPIVADIGELKKTVTCPQFRQAVGVFGMALQTGQLAPLLGHFNLPNKAVIAAQKGDIQSFAEVLSGASQISVNASSSSESGSTVKADDGKTPTPKTSTEDNSDKDKSPDNMELD